jgi:hypothetical protein
MIVPFNKNFTPGAKPRFPLPPKESKEFVDKLLEAACKINVQTIDPSWIPIGILGTLHWVTCSAWWLFHYGSVRLTDENTGTLWIHNQEHEWDPEKLLVFRWNDGYNAFDERWDNMGLTQLERVEAINFVIETVFESFRQKENIAMPDRHTVERIAWATFMWLLSENGTEWCCEKDMIFECAYDFGETFLALWDDPDWVDPSKTEDEEDEIDTMLIDPRRMEATERPIGTCKACNESLWCVSGFSVSNGVWTEVIEPQKQRTFEDMGWYYICHACATDLNDRGVEMDKYDHRIEVPSCGNTLCHNTSCPHMKKYVDEFGRITSAELVDIGRERVNIYKQLIENSNEALPHFGGSADDLIDHFNGRSLSEGDEWDTR